MVEIEKLQKEKSIGIIGLGDMGRLYARRLTEAGWR
jgi:prephenate dehydrogenase (NADP+)